MPTWTEQEVELLIECYQTEGARRCAKALGRTENSVKAKVQTLRKKGIRFKGTHTLEQYANLQKECKSREIKKDLNQIQSMYSLSRDQLYEIWYLVANGHNPTTIELTMGFDVKPIIKQFKLRGLI